MTNVLELPVENVASEIWSIYDQEAAMLVLDMGLCCIPFSMIPEEVRVNKAGDQAVLAVIMPKDAIKEYNGRRKDFYDDRFAWIEDHADRIRTYIETAVRTYQSAKRPADTDLILPNWHLMPTLDGYLAWLNEAALKATHLAPDTIQ